MNRASKMSLIPLKTNIKVTSPRKSTIFTGGRRLNIMPEARSESNKKKLMYTLIHF
jgi:hypothetical protein